MTSAAYPRTPDPAADWTGAKRRYDLVKEATIAVGVVALLTVLLAAIFSSPDVKAVTVSAWATAAPKDFLATALSELDGTSGVATYGPPYTHAAGAGQNVVGGLSLQRAFGVRIPVDPATSYVLGPLSIPAHTNPVLARALAVYSHATPARQQSWTQAFGRALDRGDARGVVRRNPAAYGPVPVLMAGMLAMARSGGLDGALVSTDRFYQSDFTKALLFLADGGYLESLATKEHLLGSQWGMMNETGNFPGQAWLWLYTFWYQIPPFSSSDNADAQIWALMAVLSLALVLVPFIPGVRSLPRWIPLYRLIWRDYYRVVEERAPADALEPPVASRREGQD